MRMRKNKKKTRNQGNTYIMVVATLSFLAVLVAAMLVAVALCYRLKAYDINARDNFYYLEQAMDEIYAGVGSDAMKHLNNAYDDTIEVLVFFDVKKQAYVTMDDDKANTILKNTYMKLVKDDPNYADTTAVTAHLKSFISNAYDASTNQEGVMLSVENITKNTDDVTIKNLILKREALYSTVNTRKDSSGNVVAGDTFVQTITTDLVIGKPEFDVNFNTIDSDLSDLYEFIMVADKGVEINGVATKVNITGNIYAAADFYNKDYNITDTSDPNYITKSSANGSDVKYAAVSSYKSTEKRYAACNGKLERSMYSGIYVNGADVIVSADRVIVPGTIAAFNSSSLIVSSSSQSKYSAADVWADGIVLGGYSLLKQNPTEEEKANETVQGSVVNMRANAYIYDDLEINAAGSDFALVGNYYGYNYASLDNRTYTDVCVKANGGRTYASSVTTAAMKDGETITGQAHYNSSAILVNGEDSSLDLSSVSNMYIAGQAYIETSKVTTTHDKTLDESGKETSEAYQVTNKDGELEAVSFKTYDYPSMKEATATDEADNYTTNTDTVEKNKNKAADQKVTGTNVQDYRTGEAISIKSNQLAYIPTEYVTDTEDGLYLSLPSSLRSLPIFKDTWKDLAKIPIIKTVVSGKVCYFFDFSTDATQMATTQGGLTTDVMNNFIAEYAQLFKVEEGKTTSTGEDYGLTDITDYDYFKIKMLSVDKEYDAEKGELVAKTNDPTPGNIYSNSAISVMNGTTVNITAKSSDVNALVAAGRAINRNITEQNKFIEKDADKRTDGVNTNTTTQTAATMANNVTTSLQSQYKEVKWTLSATSGNPTAVNDAHSMKESDITPINYYFFFNKITEDKEFKLNSGYKVWISDGDVNIDKDGFSDGNVKGLVICKGDVTFDTDVKSFEGLIVTGSKIIINGSVNLMANAEIVKTILRECDESQQYSDPSKNHFEVCELFQQYISVYKQDSPSGAIETENTKSISAVQFEDILSFNNWKKNVD